MAFSIIHPSLQPGQRFEPLVVPNPVDWCWLDLNLDRLAEQMNQEAFQGSRIAAVLEVARLEIGTLEGERYRPATNSKHTDPFCVSFVIWCLKQVYHDTSLPVYAPTCCSGALRRWARRKGLIRETPMRGDIFLELEYPGGPCNHVGFVEHVISDVYIIAIDANGMQRPGYDGNRVPRCVPGKVEDRLRVLPGGRSVGTDTDLSATKLKGDSRWN